MPKPKWGRKDVFEDGVDAVSDALPQRDVKPGSMPDIPTSVLNRVYETGAAGFPDIDFVSPEEKRIEELEGQLAEIQQQLQSHTNAMMVQDGNLIVHDFQLTPTGLVPPDDMSFESWEQIGHLLFRLEGSIQWLIGDWLVYGANLKYGDITHIAEALGREPRTLHDYAYVSRSVEFSIRIENLSFGHHQLVAGIKTVDEQRAALGYASRNSLSIADFRKWLRHSDRRPRLPIMEFPADPISRLRRIAQRGVGTLTQEQREEIKADIRFMQRWLADLDAKIE